MTLLLKQLDIHGFKSFATPTQFVFDRGITAIVGPNGSGKSNVAEALRWVLGEQGYASLRSRKTEDVIFSGSERRSSLGMADVTVTFDNRDGDLPLAFSEVTVGRRAFRSGESQYLINGARVRLKDVQQLVAPLGQAYTIIGQGLVDAALSQRPEERRGLFEHAAGIGGLRMRANEADRSLAESAGNAERLRDILGELEPRVRSLERSARLAREYGAVRDRLHGLQRHHYARLWRSSTERIDVARRELKAADSALGDEEERHVAAGLRLGELRGKERRLELERRRLTDAIATADRELATERHRRELLDARVRAAEERLADRQASRADALRQRDESISEQSRMIEELTDVEARLRRTQGHLSEIEAAGEAARARRSELELEAAGSERMALELTRERASTAGGMAALADRLQALDVERAALATTAARDARERDELGEALDAWRVRHDTVRSSIAAAELENANEVERLAMARTTLAEGERSLADRERELATLQARLESLERVHLAGEGLYAGVRAVLRGARAGNPAMSGILGTLAELIDVPMRYETAIEVALGPHLQDVVVERWADADAAIAFLKGNGAGRATFQPLDTVRGGRRREAPMSDPGMIGVAAELIEHDGRVAPIIANTLGQTLVVDDLDAARRLLLAAPVWTIVTLAGEIARPGGSVTGGSRSAESGLLARERERRSLPATIERTRDAIAADRQALERDAQVAAELARGVAERTATLDTRRNEVRALDADRVRLERELATVSDTLLARAARSDALDARWRSVNTEQAEATATLLRIDAQLAALSSRRDEIIHALAQLPSAEDAQAAGARVEIAGLGERRTALCAARDQVLARVAAARAAASERAAEIERIQVGLRAYGEERLEIDVNLADLEGRAAADRTALPPIERDTAEVAVRVRAAEQDLDAATVRIRDAERERDRVSLGLARAQDEQVFLSERVRNDLDLNDPTVLLSDLVSDDSADDPTATDSEMGRLRERLRRMAIVGDDVLEQYESESARLAFMSGQLDDVERAEAGLRQVLADLNAGMAERFEATFREVGAAFETTFVRLFGGGSARLALHSAGEGGVSIDIIAQPPGKRVSGLAALSGGERALTAVALLIAIQRVNPSPFCLLDEVDAALDESNVLRFRDELRDLSGTTQFIVITHNRGTIEGADTLYGVTMGGDSDSRVISLRLEEAVRQVEARQMAEAAG